MRLSAVRFVQGVKELTIKASQLVNSFTIALPGNVPSVGSIPRFKDAQGNLEWFDLSTTLEALQACQDSVTQLSQAVSSGSNGNQSQAIAQLQNDLTSLSQSLNQAVSVNSSQATSIQSLNNALQQLQNSLSSLVIQLAEKENRLVAQNLLDAHNEDFNHEYLTGFPDFENQVSTRMSSLHPFFTGSAYLFNDFYGGSVSPFINGNSGTGSSTSFLTDTSSGYFRLNSGTAINARAVLRTALSALRLGRTNNAFDLFRVRFYVSAMIPTDYSVARVGFFNNEGGTPTNGIYLECNISLSPNWRLIVVSSSFNNGTPQVFDTGVAITTARDEDFKIRVFSINGQELRAYATLNDQFSQNLFNFPSGSSQNLFFGANIIKTLGATNNSISLDHMGGGVKQPTWIG